MEIISSIASKISEYAIGAIIHQFGYLVYYNDNIKGLKEQVEILVSARSRMHHLIDEAKHKAEDIEDDVCLWLTKVDEIAEEAYNFLINVGEEKAKNCSNASCFNLVQRHRLSRKAKKMANELTKIQEQGKIDKVSYHAPLQGIESTVPGYLTFESRMSIIEEIMKALQDPHINMIGVYGMGGIGKTMLVKAISCQLKKSKLFEPIIMVIVGQNPDVTHIQGLLGDMLNLSFGQETKEGRAALLRKRLQREKKILIIFDDIWSGLDFESIGIPSNDDDNEGRKILVTSRSQHVLSNTMGIEKNFEVKDLTREESWKFFKQMLDESIESNRELNKIAMEVANKCGKLPIALVIVAKALKGKPLHTWRDALRQLKNPTIVDIEGVSKEVYASLKLSYDNLNSREAKLLFLLCSIFPDDYDIDIDELSRYTVGLKFLQDVNTLLTARDKILTLVDDLESSCLLQKSGNSWDDKPSVKMHDVVRDVAIYIASKDDRMCTLSYGKGLSKWQDEKTHGHYTAIFANCVNFQGLPEKLSFPRLELLALVNKPYRKMDLFRIPTGCLEGMEKLKVLHLEQIRFSLPPTSSNYLVNLRTLLLIRCRLGNIDNIGELKNLEILDFSSSDIMELPLSTRQLSRLKQLRVSYCNQLEVIPPGVISRLTKLEELYLDHSFCRWEVEGFNYSQKKNASLSELDNLSSLTSIILSIPNVRYLPERAFLNNKELECFQIAIGRDRYNVNRGTYKKILDIKTNSSNVLLKEGVNRLLNKSESLSLDATNGVKNVVFELYRSVSPNLRCLTLDNNEDVKYLVSEFDEKLSCKGFSILESLILRNMWGLETIIQGYCSMKTANVFTNLKIIVVVNCNKMKYLFSFSSIKGLLNLEEIHVWECNMMETIVVVENEAIIDKIEFKKLKKLWLFSLPQLKSFCGKAKGKELIQSQSHEIVEEEDTYSITPFDCKIAFPNLRTVYIRVKNIWDDLLIASNLNKLERIDLNECEVLKSVFAGETIRNIEELQILHIRNCDLLEEVFRIQKLNNVNNNDTFAFSSKLDWLILQNLPNLKQVWRKDPDGILISFQCLKRVEFDQCPELTRVFPAYLTNHLQQLEVLSIIDCGIDEIFESEFEISKVSFPKLRSLEIKDVDNLEIIWHNKLTLHDMSNLQIVKLDNCKSLKGIFTSNVMSVLKKLKELCVQNCDSVEEVFEINPTIKSEEENLEVATISLKKLQLRNLRSLKHVWSNDPYGLYHFENLYDVEIIGCPKLITMVPASLERDFSYHLQRLHVDDSMDEIFMKKETSKTKTLEGEVEFNQDSFIKLTEMELDGKKRIRELCHPNFSKELFPLLKVLKLKDVDDYETAPFSSELHQLLYGLEELQVHKAFLVEIFSYDDKSVTDEKCQSRTYSATLKKLYLTELPKLLHIWKEDYHTVQPSFDNLEVVRVENCSQLSTPVMPSSFSFQNLKKLAIYKCHGLSHLLDRSVAKTLVRLKKMKLFECKSMMTVLGYREDEGGEDDEIVFSELEVLKLYDLPKLKMFQLAKCIIKFTYLKTLAIEKCPEMKMFSPGLVCTPLLKSITDVALMSKYGDSRKKPNKFWAGNINATIRQLWEDGYDHSIHELFKEENIEPN